MNPAASAPARRVPASAQLALFVLVFAVGLLTGAGRPRVIDEYMVWLQADSLVQRGDLAVPQAERLGIWYGVRGRDGRPYAPYGPLHAALLAPAVRLGEPLAAWFGIPASQRDLVRPFAAAHLATLALAGCAVAIARLAAACGASVRAACATGAVGVLCTAWLPYAGTLFSEPFAALLLLLALRPLAERRERRALVSGSWFAATLLLRPSHAVLAPAFALGWAVATPRRCSRALVRLALWALPVAVAAGWLLWYNAATYGDPFEFGYPSHAEAGLPINTFDTPPLRGLFGLLASPGKSLPLHVPLLLLGCAALPALWRSRRAALLTALTALLGALLFFAHYGQWEGGYAWGPRYLLPVATLCLPAAAVAATRRRTGRRWLIALALAGALVNVPAVLTSPLEAERHGGYYDEHFRYRLAYPGPLAQWRLVLHYARASCEGAPPPRLGKGAAPGPVFLVRAGAPARRVAGFAAGLALLAAGAGLVLVRATREHTRQEIACNNCSAT